MTKWDHDWDEYEEEVKSWTTEKIQRELDMLENDLLEELLDPESYDTAIEIIERVMNERNRHNDAYERAMGIL